MATATNSCRIWRNAQLKKKPLTCPKSCFEPSNGNCVDVKKLQAVNNGSKIAKPVFEPNLTVRRRVEELNLCFENKPATNEKNCNLCAVQNESLPTNLCSSKCRPLRTMMRSKELIASRRPRPSYKHSILLDDDTLVGRAFPIKFRIQRKTCQCRSCKRELCQRETVTSTENMILLTNCCNVEVYPRKKIDTWHLVPVSTISGKEQFTKRTINEICKLEPKPIVLPPPDPPTINHKSLSLNLAPSSKKKASKSKRKPKKK